jgi:benzodiazapine receptor
MNDMTIIDGHRGSRRWLTLLIWLAVVFAVGAVGSLVTLPKIPTWYAGLTKPWFNPPNGLFGPVWTVLYVLMAVAAWRIAEMPADPARSRALRLFCLQLALNALWSPVFFGLEAPKFALCVIAALLVCLAATLIAFLRIDRFAGLLLAPYLVWVGYAAALNGSIAALN